MVNQTAPVAEPTATSLHAALVVDQLTFDRLGPMINYLCVGLLDYIQKLTLITSAPAARQLSLGPVQVILHQPLRWYNRQAHLRRTIQKLQEVPPDIIHGFTIRSAVWAQALAGHYSCPLIGHLLGSEDLQLATNWPVHSWQGLICASEVLQQNLQQQVESGSEILYLIRPGLLTESSPHCFSRPEMTPSLLCMTAFEPALPVADLIRAVRLLQDEGLEVMLFLAARGPHEKFLRQLTEKLQLHRQITFTEPATDWNLLMKGADVFLVPGVVDRVDVRLLHALASGVCAITGPVPNSDFMIHQQTGWICDPPSPESYAAAIQRLISEPHLAQAMSARALEYCRQQHSLSRMAERTAAVYQQIIAQRLTGANSAESLSNGS
ncbi:MAG: D-inositol-3-phosphate glycosyltransferase [Phycisphaerae bacterium]|nr:D-inositol-3-phosphate glycosyltransferase [Phycisphaerae bacterium]